MKKYIAIINLLLGILATLVPTLIFPVCSGDMKMDCMYTGKIILGLGILIIVLSILTFILDEASAKGISLSTGLIGILIVSIPTILVGVCGNPDMTCHIATKPAIIVLGIILAIVNLAYVIFYRIKAEKSGF